MNEHPARCACSGPSRRGFLADAGMGFVGLALGAMLHRDGVVRGDAVRRLECRRTESPISRPERNGSSG